MKAIPAPLQAHYETGSTTLAILWRLTRTDGAVYGFTDHDEDISYGGVLYRRTSSFDAAAFSTKSELNTDNSEMRGLLDDEGIVGSQIEAGLWDGASVLIQRVNWADLTMGAEVLRTGSAGTVQRLRGLYVLEIRGLMQAFQNQIVEVITPTCRANLGDTRCGVDIDGSPGLRVASAITSVASRRAFTAAGLAQAAGYFTGGAVTFTSGLCSGISMEIQRHQAGGVIALQLEMQYALTLADTFTIVPGCDKTKATCIAKFDNVLNFRGFSFVPGSDRTLLVGGQ